MAAAASIVASTSAWRTLRPRGQPDLRQLVAGGGSRGGAHGARC
jgi:hypothetical protein